jgi:uncharacterized protein YukE
VSSKVIVDADEMERFARMLQAFNAMLYDGTKQLAAESSRLAESWRDPAHEKFSRELEQTVTVLHQFIRTSETYITALISTARRTRDVHG